MLRSVPDVSRHLSRFAAIALAGLCLASAGCGDGGSGSDTATADVVPASVRTFPIETIASGELEAKNQVEIRSRVERTTSIVEIVPEGTRVKKGDVLVRLNSDEMEQELKEEELQLGEAQLNLEAAISEYEIQERDNEAALRKAELAVDLAELALEQWEKGDKVKKLQELNTQIDKTKRDLERLEEKFAKSQDLYDRNFISYDEFKRDEIALLEARAAAETAQLEKEVYTSYQMVRDREQKISDLEEARSELERVKKVNEINLKNKASRRENRAVQVKRREERLAEWQAQLEACTMRAPRDGLVVYATSLESQSWRTQSEGPLAVGRQVRNNDLLIALPDTSEMVASVKVHESLAGRIKPGQRAEIQIDAAGLTVPGRVESIGVLAEGGGWRDPNRREYTVRVTVESREQSADLKPSMRCEAKIVLGNVEDSLSVPIQAVFSDGAVQYVHVEQGGAFKKTPVSLGRRSDLYAEIESGIDEGTPVLVRQPEPGEILAGGWSEAELTEAGYAMGPGGRPERAARVGEDGGAVTRPASTREAEPASTATTAATENET